MKSEAVIKNYSVKKGVLKNFAEFTRKSLLRMDYCMKGSQIKFNLNIFMRTHQRWRPLYCRCSHDDLRFYLKGAQLRRLSCEICKVLQNLIRAELYWVTTSDSQQHFWRIACFIKNISIYSQCCLGIPETALCKQ